MKKRVKKIMICILLGLLVLILIPVAFFGLRIVFDLSNPLRQPVEQIRADVFDITPLGTSIEEVIRIIENNEVWRWNGRIIPIGFPADPAALTLVGSQSIRVRLGSFTNIFSTNVVAWWGFDEDGKLIDIRVQKHIIGW